MERILSDISEILGFNQWQLLCSSLVLFATDSTEKNQMNENAVESKSNQTARAFYELCLSFALCFSSLNFFLPLYL